MEKLTSLLTDLCPPMTMGDQKYAKMGLIVS